MKRIRAAISLSLITLGLAGFGVALAASTGPVVIVPVQGMVDDGMAHLVARAVAQANDLGAKAIVLEVDSNGGLVEAAQSIKDSVLSAHAPVIAYVTGRAFSSAALISLTSNTIIMAPGASIGSAEPHPDTPENVSALRSEFESSALRNHRNPMLAASMVDRSIDEPAYK
ncbi:MAG TPA: ATP-dependent Clp protease proteolytic subunit [Candidatus Baltobacteraceae bacterium]|nr:ATP-dependent Clp protease proteolytic subunit [Candidatus Baltobacteraceae bacterium]